MHAGKIDVQYDEYYYRISTLKRDFKSRDILTKQ